MVRRILIIALFLIGSPVLAHDRLPSVFDGKRQGFVIGLGAGYPPHVRHIREEEKVIGGLWFNLLLGHGWDELNLMVFHLDGGTYGMENPHTADTACFECGTRLRLENQGFMGLTWYHYFKRGRLSPLMIIGTGLHGCDDSQDGFGILAGAGLEVVRHFQVTGNLVLAKSSPRSSGLSIAYLSVLLTALAY